MNVQEVLSRFALLAGLTAEESAPWLPVCGEAVQEINGRVKTGVDTVSQSGRLCVLAAAFAFYRYTLYRGSGAGMESFQAGDVTVSSDWQKNVQTAREMWNETAACAADLLQDSGFIFCGVKA